MLHHATAKRLALVFPLVMILAISALSLTEAETTANSSASQASCATTTDADLVKAIKDKIKADARFDDQLRHINVSSVRRVVTLRGFVRGRPQVDSLGEFARTTPCVRRVINKLKRSFVSLCGAGTKACGDICIPRGAACNIENIE